MGLLYYAVNMDNKIAFNILDPSFDNNNNNIYLKSNVQKKFNRL